MLGAGCGSEPAEFDKAANYTPESLAQELVLRYRAMNPSKKASSRSGRGTIPPSTVAGTNKADKKASTKTTKNTGAPTIDDVLDDIKHKMTLIPEEAPTEIIKKMIATISGDNSLSEGDKKTLTELIGRLAD